MESVKLPNSFAIAESQDEYNTVHGVEHEAEVGNSKTRAVTIAMKFTPDEIDELIKNGGIVYYTQITGNISPSIRPFNLSPFNPLEDLTNETQS